MQEEKTLVPSFGMWDADTEIPYTTVFEKVRATKDGKPLSSSGKEISCQTPKTHQFRGKDSLIYPQYANGKYSDASSELHRGKTNAFDEWAIQNKKTAGLQWSSSRRSSLEQIADHIFAESQHAAGSETPVVQCQPTIITTSWQEKGYVSSRAGRESYLKENVHVQPLVGGLSNGLHHGSSSNDQGEGHEAYGGRMPGFTASPRKEHVLHKEPFGSNVRFVPSGIQTDKQRFQTNNRSGEMPPDTALPKFGDWDALDPSQVEFTVIFDKIRNDRKDFLNNEFSSKKLSPDMNEDLYKPTSTRRPGFGSWICCGVPSTT